MDQITGDKKEVTPKVKRDCKEGKAKALRGKRGRAERPKKSKLPACKDDDVSSPKRKRKAEGSADAPSAKKTKTEKKVLETKVQRNAQRAAAHNLQAPSGVVIKENKITESKKRKNVEEDESEGIKKPKLEEETPAVARSPRSPVKELLDTKSSPKRKAEDDPSPAKKRAKEGEHTPILIGLCNSGRSCYQNSVLQCLGGFSQLTEALLPRAVDILDRAELRSLTNADLATIRGCQSRRKGNKKSLIREILEQSKEDVLVEAYLGDFFERMRSAQAVGESTSPYLLTTVFALLEGKEFNGESSEDASDFLERLLSRLESEELQREPKAAQDTVVQKGFGGKSETSFDCSACGSKHRNGEDWRTLTVALPRSKEPISLQECVIGYNKPIQPEGYRCEGCKAEDTVTKTTKVESAPDNIIVKLTRTDHWGKILTKVVVDQTIEVDCWSGLVQYEMCSFVEHHGPRFIDGHYTACKKVGEEWWKLDDKKVDKRPDKHHQGTIFFLKKMQTKK